MKPTHITPTDLLPLLDKDAKVAEKRIAELEQPTSIEEAKQAIETLFFCIHLNAQQGESFKSYFEREKIFDRSKEYWFEIFKQEKK